MRRLALAAALVGTAVLVGPPRPAHAQIAAAIGKPLGAPDLPVGTISVRVIAGSMAKPIVGTTVTLTVNGTPRQARTDAAGRAQFGDLPPGATVQAKVTDEDQKDVTSEEFPVPSNGGARLLLTTKPFEGGAGGGGAPFAGGAGMPEPRQMSGEARPEQADPAGTLTVRVTYDDFADTPAGVEVALVGYAADDTVTMRHLASDAQGRAVFTDLDRSGGTAYYAMALLPRGLGFDRLASSPVILDPQVGVRMVLSGAKRKDEAPPVDDLAKLDNQSVPTPAGQVRVGLEGLGDLQADVALVDAATQQPIAHAKPQQSPPDPSRVQGAATFSGAKDLPAGTLDVLVHGGAGGENDPLPDIEVQVVPAKGDAPGLASKTGADGTVRMALADKQLQRARVTVNGRQLVSEPFDLSVGGGRLDIAAHWDADGRPQALFDVSKLAPGQVVYATAMDKGALYRSLPFQPLAGAGTHMSVFVYPRTLFRFQMHGFVEDDQFAVQGRLEVTNYSWIPYRAPGGEGLLVPLPKGFKGGVVFDPDQSEVAVAQGDGFRIVRPIPPGGRQFHGGFQLAVEGGSVAWNMDLPLGTYQSQLDIREVPGMSVKLPPHVTGDLRTIPQGSFYVVDNIQIFPKQAMVLSVSGLPSPPEWRVWIPRMVGVLVVLVLFGGIWFGFVERPSASASAKVAAARRQKLLDELVELERDNDKADPKRKAEIVAELEQLWT